MSSSPLARLTPEEYLGLERVAATKHEFIDGLMVDMAGGSPAHGLIATNVGAELRSRIQLRRSAIGTLG